jgi:DNA repair protein RecN (Recombination protein N)
LLTKLSIQNYALIEDIEIDFLKGFTTISGETGAGKSILLGGLGLILGNRAEANALMDSDKKCVIEGEFYIADYHLQAFFNEQNLDYEIVTIIRRELLPSGKSRAFVNDTPVKLGLLSEMQERLIDVHSQHQTLQLNNSDFQFSILDAFANNSKLLENFTQKQIAYLKEIKEYDRLQEQIRIESEQHDYHLFLFDELEKADFKVGEQENMEIEIDRLNNIELIAESLSIAYQNISQEDIGIQSRLLHVKQQLEKIRSFSKTYENLALRLDSLYIELDDIEVELANLQENENVDTNVLEVINTRMQLLMHLYQKHQVDSVNDLLQVQNKLSLKVARVTDASSLLENKKQIVTQLKNELFIIGEKISINRKNKVGILQKELEKILHKLGMPYAHFLINILPTDLFYNNGIDQIQFLFAANQGGEPKPIKQVASGGELSRIMLAVKSVMAKHRQLPTVIFDEIDSGISGEISLKMANIMDQMAQNMQVIAITHLPQIAAKGKQHLKVFKYEDNQRTKTSIKGLSKEERLHEIAEMLGGKNITETALNHAEQLLG